MRQKSLLAAAGAPSAPTSLIAYYRVSTASQGRSGLGIEAQQAAVAQYVASSGGLLIHEFQDIESGKRDDRPQLEAALAACRQHRGTLVVAKLDRLTRNTAFLLTLVEGQGDAGVVFCDLPMLPPGPVGKFFLTVMAAIAELERGFISQRTKAALAAAKARGQKLGNPNLRSAGAGAARKRQARDAAKAVMPYIRAARKAGASTLKEVAAALEARGIKTPTGLDSWSPEQVRRAEKTTALYADQKAGTG
jgi:DNA invertase Pin-like site-specific DNA recombinase